MALPHPFHDRSAALATALAVGFLAVLLASPAAGEVVRPPHESRDYVTRAIHMVAEWYQEVRLGDEKYFGGNGEWASLDEYYSLVEQLMIEIGNHETRLGTLENSYNDGVNYGWPQFDKITEDHPDVVFAAVMARLKGKSLYPKRWQMSEDEMKAWAKERVARIRSEWERTIRYELKLNGAPTKLGINTDEWVFDPESLDIRLLDYSDLLSTILLREAIDEQRRGLNREISPYFEARVDWWARRYNFADPTKPQTNYAGKVKNYAEANLFKDRNGIEWVYTGTIEDNPTYYAKSWESAGGFKSYMYLEDKEPVTYACLEPEMPTGIQGTGNCIWVTYCDGAYSAAKAGTLVNGLKGSEAYVEGAIAVMATTNDHPGPAGYESAKLGDYGDYLCGGITRVDIMYPGCESFAKNEVADAGLGLSPGYCTIALDGLPSAVIAAATAEPGPVRLAKREPLKNTEDNALSSTSTFQTHLTVYMARLQSEFKGSGIAYQVLPSGLGMAKPVDMTLLYEGMAFTHGDGVFAYRFEDEEIEASCNMTVLREKSTEIGSAGGAIILGNITVTFPEGGLSNRTTITVKELMLECANETMVTGGNIPEGGNITVNETGSSGGGRQPAGQDYLFLAIIGMIALLAIILAARLLRARFGGGE